MLATKVLISVKIKQDREYEIFYRANFILETAENMYEKEEYFSIIYRYAVT